MSGFVKWHEKNGPDDSYVLSTRIWLSRNLNGFPFPNAAPLECQEQVLDKVLEAEKALTATGRSFTAYRMEETDETLRQIFAEHRLVTPEFLRQIEGRGLILSDDEQIAIMVNEEDHIRIQVTESGLNLQKALEIALDISKVLEEALPIAFDETLGYLTASPAGLGTGMQASVFAYLFGLTKLDLVPRLTSTLSKMGMSVSRRCEFGKESSFEYCVSNRISLGISEMQAAENLNRMVLQVLKQETAAQSQCFPDRAAFEDQLFRTLGQLKFARQMSYAELCNHLNLIRIGICQKQIALPPHLLNTLQLITGPVGIGVLQESPLSPQQKDALRATLVQQVLAEAGIAEA